MSERWCGRANHFQPVEKFDRTANGLAKYCRACEAGVLPPMTGVDIDAIHFKRGAVAPHLRRKKR